VNEAFDARFELDEDAVLGNGRNASLDLRTDRIDLDHGRPGIRQKLFVAE
jgi:hypothetical protein